MRRAEQRGNKLAIVRACLQRQERLLHLRETFLGFLAERLQQHFSVDFHIPLQNPDYRIACICPKHDALPAVHANSSGSDGDLCFRQNFQSDFNVAASKMLFFMRIRLAQGIEQAAATKYFCAKLSTIRARFEELLQQYGNGDTAVARGRHTSSIPTWQHIVGGAADGVNGIPDTYADARTENEGNGFPFCRNENLTGMKKVRIR